MFQSKMRKPKRKKIKLSDITKTMYGIDLFTPDPENARGHDARNIRAIADSIKQFGQRIPILVDADLVIRKGNGTWLAMKLLKRQQIWAIPLELEGPAKAAFALADNRAAELAHWEWQIVAETLKQLEADGQNITELGFADFELEPLLNGAWKPPTINAGEETTDDATKGNGAIERIIHATDDEWSVIAEAIRCRQEKSKRKALSEGRALSLVCQEWINDTKAYEA